MRQYYRNRVALHLQYRTIPNSNKLEVAEIGLKAWQTSARSTEVSSHMHDLYKVPHPQSWLFATVSFTIALLTLAYLVGGA